MKKNFKILQVISSLHTGGAEKLLVDSVPLYQMNNISVDVLSLKSEKTLFWEKLEKTTNGTITGLTNKSLYNPFLVFKIIPFLKKYDIIHFHLFPTLYWVVLAKWISFSKVKLIYTEHSTSNRRRENKFFKIVDRFIYGKIDKIVTIADEVDLNLKKHLELDQNKFQLINNGVDVQFFHAAKPYPKAEFFGENDFILIQVSSFRWQKDQATLIKSLSNLPNDVKLMLVGDGPLIEESKKLVKDLEVEKRVLFLGNRIDVPRLLNTADVVVLSSKHEGLSLSSIEGMSVENPFVASDVMGLREIVKDHGLLFEQGNHEMLASLIIQLKENQEFYKKVALQCLKRAKEFDIKKMVSKYTHLYQEIINDQT